MKKYVFLSLLLIAALALLADCREGNPHLFNDSQCSLCHKGDPSSPFSLATTSLSRACTTCHSDFFDNGYMHPVDVSAVKIKNVNIPEDFPLSGMGQITCNTCHDIHSEHITISGAKSYFLRRDSRGKAFCATCHTKENIYDSTDHTLTLGEAHFQSTYISTGSDQTLDAMTKNCVSCHDGTYGSSVAVSLPSSSTGTTLANTGLGKKHPVGMNYSESANNKSRRSDLRPQSQVDPRLQFFDGKVGCGTCHNPYSTNRDKLVMSNRRSALCLACHKMSSRSSI